MIIECLDCTFWRQIPCAPEPEDEDDKIQHTETSSAHEGGMDIDGQNVKADAAPKAKRYRHKRKGRDLKFRRKKKSVKAHEKIFFEQGHSVFVGNNAIV